MKEILDLLAARYSIERQHIESFDRYFATKTNPMSSMQRIVDEFQMDPGSPPGALIFHSSEKDEIRLQFGRESAKDPVTIWNDRPVIVERNGEINSSTPADCRVRDHTYQSPMYLRYRIFINDQFHSESVALIGYHPVITGSSYFTNEQSDRQSDRGFMIIRGVERFFPFAEYGASGFIQTSHPIGNPKSVISRLIVRTSPTQRTGCSVEMNYTGESFLVFRENIQVPLFLVFTAFGLTDREIYEMFALPNQIRNLTILTMLENMRSLIRAEQLDTFEQTSAYLIERIKGLESIYHQTPEVPKNFLDDYLFPHLGTDPVTRPAKLVLLTDMFLRVLEFNEGKLRTIDRDHLGMKRLKMCGETLEEIFVLLYKRFLKDLSSRINRIVRKKLSSRLVTSIKPYFKPDLFTTGIEQILATGVFQTGGADEEYTITELFTANTLFAQRANLQKVFSTLSKTQTHFDAREQHPTAWGRYCATETPEGSNCGLIKRLATGTRVSFQASLDGIWTFQRAYMEKHHTDCISGLKQLQTREYAIVYCQGHPLFLVPNAAQFLTEFEEYRRQTKGIIENTITIAHDQDTNTIELLTDQGRIIRPVFSVENDRIRNLKRVYRRLMTKTLDTEYLLDNRVVRYIDAQQEENEVVADRWIDRPARCSNCKNVFYHRWDRLDLSLVSVPKFRVICHKCSFEEPCRNVLADHHSACEIDPGTILGLSTSLLAFPEFNSAPRSSKGAAMLRQTISTQGEFQVIEQTLPKSEFLLNGQRPIVQTETFAKHGFQDTFLVNNYVVAICPFYGFNMQDAIILNRDSIDRGLGKCLKLERFVTSILDYPSGESDRIEPLDQLMMKRQEIASYQKLDEDGLINCAAVIQNGDVILSKNSPQKFLQSDESVIFTENRRDVSLIYNTINSEPSRIEKIILTTVPSSFPMIKIFVRTFERLQVGDKIASRHGQKGVIGRIVPGCDLPFLEGGIIPDMIINPHGLPARMTPGHLLEMFAGLLGAQTGELYDGTPFTHPGIEFFRQIDGDREARRGLFAMYNPFTATRNENSIFAGIISYLRLHHIASNKLHYRSTGPTQILTRQPTEGKSRHGGLRVGEMEKDCLNAHGAASIARERLAGVSDLSSQYICTGCDQMVSPRVNETQQRISPCHPDNPLRMVQIPYGFKLLVGELFALGIKVTFDLKQRNLNGGGAQNDN